MCASRNLPIPFTNGDERDALGGKEYHHYRSGVRKKIKRGYQRRVRHEGKYDLKREND